MSYLALKNGIVYGPVASRRLGRSLGINLLPAGHKVCTFNCVYCHYGPTDRGKYEFPAVSEVVAALEERLRAGAEVDYLTFAGNGEPTIHPDFLSVVKAVREVRDRLAPGVPLALLSNSTQLGRQDVVQAVSLLDFPVFKLDAGDAGTFSAVNRPVARVRFREIVSNLRALGGANIQSVMVDGPVKNWRGDVLDAWLGALSAVRPRLVQLYTLDSPIEEQGARTVAGERLEKIGERARREAGIDVQVYR